MPNGSCALLDASVSTGCSSGTNVISNACLRCSSSTTTQHGRTAGSISRFPSPISAEDDSMTRRKSNGSTASVGCCASTPSPLEPRSASRTRTGSPLARPFGSCSDLMAPAAQFSISFSGHFLVESPEEGTHPYCARSFQCRSCDFPAKSCACTPHGRTFHFRSSDYSAESCACTPQEHRSLPEMEALEADEPS